MQIQFKHEYKSIDSLAPIDLPSFVVLTGVNGAGKSQFLEALENGSLAIEGIPIRLGENTQLVRKFSVQNLAPQDVGDYYQASSANDWASLWSEVRNLQRNIAQSLTQRLDNAGITGLTGSSMGQLIDSLTEHISNAPLSRDRKRQLTVEVQDVIQGQLQSHYEQYTRGDPRRSHFVRKMQERFGKDLATVDENSFLEFAEKNWHPYDLFEQSFARLFVEYRSRWAANELKRLGAQSGESISYLSDDAFRSQYGEPPWDFVNRILETSNIDFQVDAPYLWEERPYRPTLRDRSRSTTVHFNDLSSGERVLMSFAIAVYHASADKLDIGLPQVLLLDEPDAPLHPSMASTLLRVVQENIVERRGISVILTTHAPSTVALAPESSLYLMKKIGPNRLYKCSKDEALGYLTAGIPTLSIRAENQRQVFVESLNDAEYYRSLAITLADHFQPDISLAFIGSGRDGNEGCPQTKRVIAELTKGGARGIVGLIDRDTNNKPDKNLVVLGRGSRYSIENYLLDPLPLLALLLKYTVDKSSIGLNPRTPYTKLAAEATELQAAVNHISAQIATHLTPDPNSTKVTSHYNSGLALQIESWFLSTRGHDIERAAKAAFPQLRRFNNERSLKLEITGSVFMDHPFLVPKDLIATLCDIQLVQP